MINYVGGKKEEQTFIIGILYYWDIGLDIGL